MGKREKEFLSRKTLINISQSRGDVFTVLLIQWLSSSLGVQTHERIVTPLLSLFLSLSPFSRSTSCLARSTVVPLLLVRSVQWAGWDLWSSRDVSSVLVRLSFRPSRLLGPRKGTRLVRNADGYQKKRRRRIVRMTSTTIWPRTRLVLAVEIESRQSYSGKARTRSIFLDILEEEFYFLGIDVRHSYGSFL